MANLTKPSKQPKVKKEKVKKEKAPKIVKEKKIKKPVPSNIYTLLLLFSWLALVVACILLYMDIASYK